MSKHKRIFHKKYSGESLIDVDGDLFDAIENAQVPKDTYGIQQGTFYITVMWKPDEEELQPE